MQAAVAEGLGVDKKKVTVKFEGAGQPGTVSVDLGGAEPDAAKVAAALAKTSKYTLTDS